MKYAVVILDGAADEGSEELDGQTSFEASDTPTLDMMAKEGVCGITHNTPEGLEPSSNVCCTSILGYDPKKYPIGRGVIEAAAVGADPQLGEVFFRVNLCTIEDGVMKSYSADNITDEYAHQLADELKEALDDETFTLFKGSGFRTYLRVRGYPELEHATCEAAHNLSDMPVEDRWMQGKSANIIHNYICRANKVLQDSSVNRKRIEEGLMPANAVWIFWPGVKPDGMESFYSKRGLKAAMTTGVDLLNGLALLTGMTRVDVEGVTDALDTNYKAQGDAAVTLLEDHDIVFVHIEAPDTAGHDGLPCEKKHAIEMIDKHIVTPLVEIAKTQEIRVAALPDHPTSPNTKRHLSDPVPFVMWGTGLSANGAQAMNEKEAQKTGLVFNPGFELMDLLLK